MMATTWSSSTGSSSLTRISASVPAAVASTGISIFMDSRIMMTSSTATLSPTAASIFQTLPVTSDVTSTLAMA
jgi:hypothetical protein